MKPITPKLLVCLFLSILLFSCAKEDDGIYFNESIEELSITPIEYTAIETEILDLVNSYRNGINLASLNSLNVVSSVADSHTEYMIEKGKISHDNFDQRAQTLMNKANAKTVAENVAYGYTSAESVVNGWLNSESHRSIIENPNFTHFGISTESNNEGRNYFTNIFIKK